MSSADGVCSPSSAPKLRKLVARPKSVIAGAGTQEDILGEVQRSLTNTQPEIQSQEDGIPASAGMSPKKARTDLGASTSTQTPAMPKKPLAGKSCTARSLKSSPELQYSSP